MTAKIPPTLTVVAALSGGITIVTSTVYAVLCSIALIYRYDCSPRAVLNDSASSLFMNTLYRVYVMDDECPGSYALDTVTKSDTVFILTVITLSISVAALIVAITFIMVTQYNNDTVLLVGYIYIAACIGSLVVDLTFGTHFGNDYAAVTIEIDKAQESLQATYMLDVLRLGAMFLMVIALKGFVTHAFNIVLLILVAVYLEQYRNIIKRNGHSIHTMGTLHAYDNQPKRDAFEQRRDMYNNVFARAGPQVNDGYEEEVAPRRSMRDPQRERPEYVNSRSFDFSWQPSQEAPAHIPAFTYLREPPRGTSTPLPPASAGHAPGPGPADPWRRDWPPTPVVPAPDYSPQARRLKSAMKPY